jgi:hypothetical protein
MSILNAGELVEQGFTSDQISVLQDIEILIEYGDIGSMDELVAQHGHQFDPRILTDTFGSVFQNVNAHGPATNWDWSGDEMRPHVQDDEQR